MDSVVKRRAIIAGSIALAVYIGWDIGQGSLALAAIAAFSGLLLAVNIWADILPDALVGGAVLVGYLVGNRGFAQLSAPGIPLLPAEFALGMGLVCMVWRSARARALFVRRDSLNVVLIILILAASIRLPLDVRRNGFMALRDFATVYYAFFFFLAQDWSRHPASCRWIERCLSSGFALVAPAFEAFQLWPDTITKLTLNGNPLIFIKGDVACGFMVAGVFWFLASYIRQPKPYRLLFAAINLAGATLYNSRAAVVSLFFCVFCLLIFLIIYRTGKLLRWFAVLAAFGVAALVVEAFVPKEPGEKSLLYRSYESVLTIADVSGHYEPDVSSLDDKADNNRFRTIWWDAVIRETREDGLWFGLGFGHDLAAQFIQTYYPEDTDDFSVRSPHNVLITIFARMGVLGLGIMIVALSSIAVRAWRDARLRPGHEPNAAWMGSMGIFVTACFGVVLEGPMGAVVFWTLLGLANSYTHRLQEPSP